MQKYLTKEERRARDENMEVVNISMDLIEDNPFQPRVKYPVDGIKRLAKSISQEGLFNPISVVAVNGGYVIVGGHRRLRAMKRLHRDTVPVIIRRHSSRDNLALDLAIENAMRRDFAPAEKAKSIFDVLNSKIPTIDHKIPRAMMILNQIKLIDKRGNIGKDFVNAYGFKESDTSKCKEMLTLLDMSVNTAIKYLRLLDLPAFIQKKIITADNDCRELTKQGYVSVSMAYEFTRVKNNTLRKQLYKKVVNEGLTYTNMKFVIDKMLEDGEEGYAKMGCNLKRDDPDYGLEMITEKTFKDASLLWNWRRKKLPLAVLTLDKACFVSSLVRLRKSAMYLIDATNKVLDETDDKTKIELINKKLSIMIRAGTHGQKFRFGFPVKYGNEFGLEPGDELELKIVAIRRKKKTWKKN
jgi:ParB/RepB/Spo0J family partition protein